MEVRYLWPWSERFVLLVRKLTRFRLALQQSDQSVGEDVSRSLPAFVGGHHRDLSMPTSSESFRTGAVETGRDTSR